jgi:hypothetical protein
VVEVRARDALIVEQHIYEKLVFVVEGKGSTELWQREGGKHHRFEWQAGSLFAIPTNAFHRIANETGSPALLLCATSAPKVIDLVDNIAFVFRCPYVFRQEAFERAGAFTPRFAIEADPIRARAMLRTNFIPDLRALELPPDNRRAPAYRRLELDMADSRFYQFAGEYESRCYSKAHRRRSTAAQICIGGEGYSYLWPSALGPTPWRDSKSGAVLRQDYVYGGLIAPMRGGWFRQHFSTSVEPLRFLSWAGPNNHPALRSGRPGAPMKDIWALNLKEGGNVVPYTMQDPAPAAEYREMLARTGRTPSVNGGPR